MVDTSQDLYFIRTATDTPDWKNDHYVSPLNYVAVEKGKQYDVFYPLASIQAP